MQLEGRTRILVSGRPTGVGVLAAAKAEGVGSAAAGCGVTTGRERGEDTVGVDTESEEVMGGEAEADADRVCTMMSGAFSELLSPSELSDQSSVRLSSPSPLLLAASVVTAFALALVEVVNVDEAATEDGVAEEEEEEEEGLAVSRDLDVFSRDL